MALNTTRAVLAAHPHNRVIKHIMIDVKNIYQSNLAGSDPVGYDVGGAYKGMRRVYDVQTVGDHDVYARTPKHSTRLSPTDATYLHS